MLLIFLFVFTDIHADIAFVVHFVTAPNHLTYRGHSDYVSAVAWSPDGTRIVSASNDGTVQVWQALTGKMILTYRSLFSPRGGFIPWNTVAWSPDGKRIAIGGIGDALLLDAVTGKTLAYLGQHSGTIHEISWSPDGTYIAIGRDDTTVQVWNVDALTLIYTYTGQATDVFAVAWSPDGKRIASGSADGIVEVWDALTGDHAYTYRGHADYYWGHFMSNASVDALAWLPDGRRIASGSNDMTVQVWQAK